MVIAKLITVGKSKGILFPQEILEKYDFEEEVAIETCDEGLLIKTRPLQKLSWEDTFKEMRVKDEDWSDWQNLHDQDEL